MMIHSRPSWGALAGWHTYGPEHDSGTFEIAYRSLDQAPLRGAGWYIYDQTSQESRGPFKSSRAAYVVARRGKPEDATMIAAEEKACGAGETDLDLLLGIG